MPKITKYPRLRVHVRKGRAGQVYTYWFYDMRPEGKPDVALGKDYETALARWDELHNQRPRVRGTCEEAFERWEREKLPAYENAETRRSYAKQLVKLRSKFAAILWEAIKLPHLVRYLEWRTAKTQGNREMALFQIIWNQARLWGMTELPWPAAGER